MTDIELVETAPVLHVTAVQPVPGDPTATYRNEVRHIPDHYGHPYAVVWVGYDGEAKLDECPVRSFATRAEAVAFAEAN